jgi:hypothetical protein
MTREDAVSYAEHLLLTRNVGAIADLVELNYHLRQANREQQEAIQGFAAMVAVGDLGQDVEGQKHGEEDAD